MKAIPIINTVLGSSTVKNCLFASVVNRGVGTATIEVLGTSTKILLEPGQTPLVLFQGFGAVTDFSINVTQEASESNLILIASKRICNE